MQNPMTDAEIRQACFGEVKTLKKWQQEALEIVLKLNNDEFGRLLVADAIDQIKATTLLKSVQQKDGSFSQKKLKKKAKELSKEYRKKNHLGNAD